MKKDPDSPMQTAYSSKIIMKHDENRDIITI